MHVVVLLFYDSQIYADVRNIARALEIRPKYRRRGELGYAPLDGFHDYAKYKDNQALVMQIQHRLKHCSKAFNILTSIEKALYDNEVLSNSCLSLQMLERNLYEMAVEKVTEGVFYALTLSIKGAFTRNSKIPSP